MTEGKTLARASRKLAGPNPVLLIGGPMDGWYVSHDAPALTEAWGKDWGGRYQKARAHLGVSRAKWKETS